MGDKEKIPGKKYVGYCKVHGWLTADEVKVHEEVVNNEEEKDEWEWNRIKHSYDAHNKDIFLTINFQISLWNQ